MDLGVGLALLGGGVSVGAGILKFTPSILNGKHVTKEFCEERHAIDRDLLHEVRADVKNQGLMLERLMILLSSKNEKRA